ncbi:MAG: hypothetical protein F4X65_12170 [Chloroflexi bacterium]|nr:hypothetical protein [Chloroflexota bacterium]
MTTISNQEDLLRALRENPEWREAVRALILGDELLNLPAALQRLSDTVDRFVARQEQFNDEQRQFNDEQRQFNDEQRQFNSNAMNRFDRMESDLSFWKKDYTQRRLASRSESIPSDMGIDFLRNMTYGELTKIALAAAGGQALSDDLKSFRDADLVVIALDGGTTRYLVVEISYTADERDTRRAIRNARILEEQTGIPSTPVVASVRNTNEVQDMVVSGQVYWHYVPPHAFSD